jgi:hypothetical protein
MIAGLGLALGSALGTNVAFLSKQRGAVLAPAVRARHPLRSAVGLFRSHWFSLGWAVAVGAWGVHVGALALAPLSVCAGRAVRRIGFLAVLTERYFGFSASGLWRRSRLRCWRSTPRLAGSSWVRAWR